MKGCKPVRKLLCISFLLISLVFVLSACGDDGKAKDNKDSENSEDTEKTTAKPEIGLNKISLNEMIKKKNNNESFYLFVYDAPKKVVNQTKLLEAYNKALQEKKVKAFSLNIHGLSHENEQTIKRLNDSYKDQHRGHNPFENGGIVVVHHGKIDSAFAYSGERRFLGVAIEQKSKKNRTFLEDGAYKEIKKGVQHNLDYVQELKINM